MPMNPRCMNGSPGLAIIWTRSPRARRTGSSGLPTGPPGRSRPTCACLWKNGTVWQRLAALNMLKHLKSANMAHNPVTPKSSDCSPCWATNILHLFKLPAMTREKIPSFLAWIAICCLLSTSVRAQQTDSTVWRVIRTADFEFAGDGLSPDWQNEPWQSLPKRNLGGVQYETRMKMLYSDSGIYCLYFCQDLKLTSTLREDFSDLFNEDVVEAFFWTDEQVPMYFEYELSPFNYELPILVPNNKGIFLGWRPWHY